MFGEVLRTWLKPLLLIATLGSSLFLLGQGVDALVARDGVIDLPIYRALLPPTTAEARTLLGSLIEFLAGLVSLGITVATILVQLSANRYSSRVADLFVADRANIAFFCLAIVTPLYSFWVASLLQVLPWPTTHGLLVLFLITLNMLLLIPYVNHLFRLLKPEEIIARIRSSVDLSELRPGTRPRVVDVSRENLVTSINQLTDVILNSITNSDVNLALRSVAALRSVVVECVQVKGRAPEQWFLVPEAVFLGPAPQQLRRDPVHRCWVEFHAMKQFELIYFQALQRFPELNSAIVERTREIGIAALEEGDFEAVDACILFFNTYLRHAMNARDIRTIFHTFHQYRLLGESLARSGQADGLIRLVHHFKYYGQQCERKGLDFGIEISAYDLRKLVEVAFVARRDVVDEMLTVFLEVDRVLEDEEVETGQRGVRKSQTILAAFFLAHESEDFARHIFSDMQEERPERLRSIRDELLEDSSEEFWEIQSRAANFYHVPLPLRPHVETFFGWFGL